MKAHAKAERVGNGYAHTNSGVLDTMPCQVCGVDMDVERNGMGATGFGEAMSGRKHLHDTFRCKDRHEDWHMQIFNIREEAEETSSDKLRKLFLDEVDEILAKHCNQ